MKIIENKTFTGQTVELDGTGYIKCTFNNCHLVFRGREAFGLREPYFKNGTTMEFADGAALTVQAINQFYAIGAPFKAWIDHELKGTLRQDN